MRSELLTPAAFDAAALAGELRAAVPAPESVATLVAGIIADVRARGDTALDEYTRRFDTRGADPAPLRVSDAELDAAEEALDWRVRTGLLVANSNVEAVASAGLHIEPRTLTFASGHSVALRTAPVARAAVYAPGGRAPYPSTVMMGVIPARAAGVEEIVVCAPPGRDGDVNPVLLAACRLAGATEVYRMGGAQAIAALAYGTASVAPVDVIVGPGNLYVQEAKRQVFGQVGIDGFAGPSDLLVIADGGVAPEPLALDLLAQAEHGPGTLVVAVSDSHDLLSALAARLDEGAETGAISRLVQTENAEQALALAEAFAPEHLELVGPVAEGLAPRVTRSGCVFVGAMAATAFGDYIAGSNHILPTNGAARYASGLTAGHFLRSFSEVRIRDAAQLARAAVPVARAEGFELHARSMEARIRENG
jgi:histidinol dehydrogenase